MLDFFSNGPELKFTAGTETTDVKIEGMGSVFGVKDSHSDVVLPGAFTASLAERKAQGRPYPMYLEHSKWVGGSSSPIGVWDECNETKEGLQLRGRLIGSHPDVVHAGLCVREKLLTGLSIAYKTTPEGVLYGSKSHEPRRQLKSVGLLSIDLVADPSNPDARVTSIKSMHDPAALASLEELRSEFAQLKRLTIQGDQQAATLALEKAMRLIDDTLAGSNSPNVEERADIRRHAHTAYKALTGQAAPPGMKFSADTAREFEFGLQNGFLKMSTSRAKAIAALATKAGLLRDEEVEAKTAALPREALSGLTQSLSDFTLPTF